MSPERLAFRRFDQAYCRPFCEAWPDREDAHFMIDIVSEACFENAAFRTVHRDELVSSFMEPLEDEDGNNHTLEEAASALAFLAEQDMVVIDGDQVSIPPRFVDEFSASRAQVDASAGPVLTS